MRSKDRFGTTCARVHGLRYELGPFSVLSSMLVFFPLALAEADCSNVEGLEVGQARRSG